MKTNRCVLEMKYGTAGKYISLSILKIKSYRMYKEGDHN